MGVEILLVEDDEDSAEMMTDFLESHGYSTAWVGSGRLAVELVRKRRLSSEPAPALILLDLTLPDLEGTEVVDALKSDDGEALPPIVVASARPDDEIKRAAIRIGAAAFARKPFSLEQMLQTIDDVIRRP